MREREREKGREEKYFKLIVKQTSQFQERRAQESAFVTHL